MPVLQEAAAEFERTRREKSSARVAQGKKGTIRGITLGNPIREHEGNPSSEEPRCHAALINQEQHLRSQVDAAARSAAGVGASTSRPGALHTERLARQHEPAAPADEEIVD